MTQYQGAIESILYTAGDEGIALPDLATILGLDVSAVRQLLQQLKTGYDQTDRGVTLLATGDHYQLVTKARFAPLLHQYFAGHQPKQLSQAALETMAIIAYQQPVTRIEIDQIRGVKSIGALQTLLARQMIKEAGRKEAVGRPILYRTTHYFLNYFGLSGLKDLPSLTDFGAQSEHSEPHGQLNLFFKKKQESSTNKES